MINRSIFVLTVLLLISFPFNSYANKYIQESFDDRNIVCNDGSPYHYYVSRKKTNNVIYYFEGGGRCHNLTKNSTADCIKRSKKKPHRISNSISNTSRKMMALLQEESYFEDYSIYYFPYCTSDFWVGNSTKLINDLTWQFHGVLILKKLINKTNSSKKKRIVFAGSSAGAIAASYVFNKTKVINKRLISDGFYPLPSNKLKKNIKLEFNYYNSKDSTEIYDVIFHSKEDNTKKLFFYDILDSSFIKALLFPNKLESLCNADTAIEIRDWYKKFFLQLYNKFQKSDANIISFSSGIHGGIFNPTEFPQEISEKILSAWKSDKKIKILKTFDLNKNNWCRPATLDESSL